MSDQSVISKDDISWVLALMGATPALEPLVHVCMEEAGLDAEEFYSRLGFVHGMTGMSLARISALGLPQRVLKLYLENYIRALDMETAHGFG